jgi:hypothetical protein
MLSGIFVGREEVNGPFIELVRKAMLSNCTGDFEWINDKVALRVAGNRDNKGLTPRAIKELAQDWVRRGGTIFAKTEDREEWRDKRDCVYWIVIEDIDEIPAGLFVEMELTDDDPKDPIASMVNAHPSSFS